MRYYLLISTWTIQESSAGIQSSSAASEPFFLLLENQFRNNQAMQKNGGLIWGVAHGSVEHTYEGNGWETWQSFCWLFWGFTKKPGKIQNVISNTQMNGN